MNEHSNRRSGHFLLAQLALAISPLLVACGATDNGAPSRANVPDGASVVKDDGKAFSPEGIEYELVETGFQPKLIAATVVDDASGLFLGVRLLNDSLDTVCEPEVNALLTDALGNERGSGNFKIQGDMYESNFGSVIPCLGPGATGLGMQQLGAAGPGSKIVKVEYQPLTQPGSGAVKLADLTVEGVVISSNASGGKRVTGNVVNHGTVTIAGAALRFFAVDSGGRPFATASAQATTDLPAGGTWSFELTVPTPFNQYVAFPVWNEQ